MRGNGHGLFGHRGATPAEALLRDAHGAAREELELHELLVASDWQDERVRELRDRVAPEFLSRNGRAPADVVREATAAAGVRLAQQGTGRLDLRVYQLLTDLARASAER